MSSSTFDVIIENGLWFDGLGSPGAVRNLGIRGGRVAAISEAPLSTQGAKVIDARGLWVMPGFIDMHTHYDAEVLVAPGLGESVRHGVTTVFLGSCSLSTVHVDALDGADLFSRVEAVPRKYVLDALEKNKRWSNAAEYAQHLESLPLGPNVAAFIGHSDIRTHVLGLGRAVDPEVRPTEEELQRMERLVEDALAAGFVGMSSMTNPWDKLDGDRYRSKSLPSTFATWAEHRRLNGVLRRARRVLQSAPNLTQPSNAVNFFLESIGSFFRRPLRTSLLTAADSKTVPRLVSAISFVTRLLNRFAGADLRWQHLPVPFEIYADGIDLVVFEEFGAGRAALHLADQVERNALLRDEAYRRRFRRDYERRFAPKAWNRDFYDAHVVACPDASAVGKSFGQIADEKGIHPVDAYLDLVVEHGTRLRWKTLVANHRPEVLDHLAQRAEVHMGFADSGAHLRNMAFYNFPIRLLRRVNDAIATGKPFLSLERAVHRLTGELASWFGVDAGTLRVGDRADVVVIDPRGLDASVEGYYEAPIPEFGGLSRMVNRSDDAVAATIVGGQVVFERGVFASGFGETRSSVLLPPRRRGAWHRQRARARGVDVRDRGVSRAAATSKAKPAARAKRSAAGKPIAKPPARRTQEERRALTIEKLIEATIASVQEVGYARTTVKEICGRAGLSHGALFRFFPRVIDLIVAASEDIGRRQIGEFEARFAATQTEGEPLAVALRLVRETCRSRTNAVFYELLIAARTDPELRAALRPWLGRYFTAIRQGALRIPGADAFPPEIFEVLLFTVLQAFDGEALTRMILPQPKAEERRLELLLTFLEMLRGAR